MKNTLQEIILGEGKIVIADVTNADEGWAGISFVEEECPIGVELQSYEDTDIEMGAFLRIRSNNIESLDVLISACQRAKESLMQ